MGRGRGFLRILVVGLSLAPLLAVQGQTVQGKIALTPAPKSQAASLAGSWVLVGESRASGKPLPPYTDNVNKVRLTITGETSGTALIETPINYSDDAGKLLYSCTGTDSFKFTISRAGTSTIFHAGPETDTPGKDCRKQAGVVVSTLPTEDWVIQLNGDTLQVVKPTPFDPTSKDSDLIIITYKRAKP